MIASLWPERAPCFSSPEPRVASPAEGGGLEGLRVRENPPGEAVRPCGEGLP